MHKARQNKHAAEKLSREKRVTWANRHCAAAGLCSGSCWWNRLQKEIRQNG